jgi:uncharacterized protein (DUF433 family)
MNWEDRIVSDQEVLVGKPVIKGTRLSVEFILERLADGWTEREILENYPRLTPDDLRAVFAYASDCMKDGPFFAMPDKNSK